MTMLDIYNRIAFKEAAKLAEEYTERMLDKMCKEIPEEYHAFFRRKITVSLQEVMRKKAYEEGREEGHREGEEEANVAALKNMMEALKLTADQAIDVLKLPENERNYYLCKLVPSQKNS